MDPQFAWLDWVVDCAYAVPPALARSTPLIPANTTNNFILVFILFLTSQLSPA